MTCTRDTYVALSPPLSDSLAIYASTVRPGRWCGSGTARCPVAEAFTVSSLLQAKRGRAFTVAILCSGLLFTCRGDVTVPEPTSPCHLISARIPRAAPCMRPIVLYRMALHGMAWPPGGPGRLAMVAAVRLALQWCSPVVHVVIAPPAIPLLRLFQYATTCRHSQTFMWYARIWLGSMIAFAIDCYSASSLAI